MRGRPRLGGSQGICRREALEVAALKCGVDEIDHCRQRMLRVVAENHHPSLVTHHAGAVVIEFEDCLRSGGEQVAYHVVDVDVGTLLASGHDSLGAAQEVHDLITAGLHEGLAVG